MWHLSGRSFAPYRRFGAMLWHHIGSSGLPVPCKVPLCRHKRPFSKPKGQPAALEPSRKMVFWCFSLKDHKGGERACREPSRAPSAMGRENLRGKKAKRPFSLICQGFRAGLLGMEISFPRRAWPPAAGAVCGLTRPACVCPRSKAQANLPALPSPG
jgi:hypothetical protein